MADITDFVQNDLYPLLFNRVRDAFPFMDFQNVRGDWLSRYKLDGTLSHDGRKDKSVIRRRKPHRILEQGGESLTLIDFYMRVNGKIFIEAVRDLCGICGLELPQKMDGEAYKAFKEKQDRLEAFSLQMQRDLYSDAGKEALSYLKTGRGYSDEFIRYAGLGFCSRETASRLRDLFTYRNNAGDIDCSLPRDIGDKHVISIPYVTGTNIHGLVFRAIESDVAQKYKDAFISAKASKKYHLFGLTGLNLTGDRERDKDITIVEGELDALRASFAGVPNVVAASGGNVFPEAINEAKRRGVKRVTILLDTEGTEEEQEEKVYWKVDRAIDTIQKEGLKAFVCFLPREKEGEKNDVDIFLKTHTGEDLNALIEDADPASIYLFDRITYAAVERQGGEGGQNTFKNLDEYKRKTLDLITQTAPTEREWIMRRFAEVTGGEISLEALREEAELELELLNQSKQKQETMSLAAEAYRLAREGKTNESLSLMAEKTATLQRISTEGKYSELLRLPTAGDLRRGFQTRPKGVKTLFSFGSGYKNEQLVLPSGALTFICAPTSHGKSRMLQNLAIQVADGRVRDAYGKEANGGGDVLYFTFEEDDVNVKLQLLNIYVNLPLSRNNLRSLSSYYTTGNGFFSRDADVTQFLKKEKDFISLLETGRLRVFYKDFDCTELIDAILYLSREIKVKAVFVDYMQLLNISNTKLQRKDELKEICKRLMKLAVDTRLPIVLAAQLNREALSPVDMVVQNISEASDIEHCANIVLMLWNSVMRPLQKNSYFIDKAEKLSRAAEEIEAKGFSIGTGGKMYATLAKNRGGARNIDAVFDFNGNTGVIAPNYDPKRAEQEDLGFETDQGEEIDPFAP